MTFFIQPLYTPQLSIKILVHIIILIIFYNYIQQYSFANTHNNQTIPPSTTDQINKKKNNSTKITIQSNQAKFYLSDNKSHFSGNVSILYNENTLYADEIYLYKKIKHNTIHTILSGIGNVHYNNNLINIIGKKIVTDLKTKDIDVYHGNFSFTQQKTHGSAQYIKCRNNNHYTILQKTNFSTCPPSNKYWNLAGSQVLYDHKKENLDIWNAYFKIKTTPILYTPYIQLFLSHKEHVKHYPIIPIQYGNKHSIKIKLPYYLNINKNIHGKIITNLIPQNGIQFQNCIQYSNHLNKCSINFDLLNNKTLNKNYWLFYYYNNYIREKWHISNEYTKINNHNHFLNIEPTSDYTTNNYYLKKNILWQYNDTMWTANLIYKEFQSLNKHITNIYNMKPQLNINFYINQFNSCNYCIFSQITQFTNTNYKYPKTTRIHIEPSINILSNILYSNINTEIKLKNTYYQQNNIDFYNEQNHKNIHLKQSINRFLPQLKSHAKLAIYKKNNIHNQYIQIIEPQIQYLYIPYRNQTNIGLYDTTILEITNSSNLFKNIIYSGLDRIASANQLTSNICAKIYNKNNTELFCMSLGQTYFFKPTRTENHTKPYNHKNNITWISNTRWKIHQSLGINTNLEYNTQIKQLQSGNTIIEHRTNNNKIIQMNFRYLNSKYFSKIAPESLYPMYQKNITQIGIISNIPINATWTLSGTQFYNIKNKYTITQSIGIQYQTCCWKINAGYERKAKLLNQIKNTKKYNNKLLINLNLSGIRYNPELDKKICNILHTNTLPYQSIL